LNAGFGGFAVAPTERMDRHLHDVLPNNLAGAATDGMACESAWL
jgi:hypothetical protein